MLCPSIQWQTKLNASSEQHNTAQLKSKDQVFVLCMDRWDVWILYMNFFGYGAPWWWWYTTAYKWSGVYNFMKKNNNNDEQNRAPNNSQSRLKIVFYFREESKMLSTRTNTQHIHSFIQTAMPAMLCYTMSGQAFEQGRIKNISIIFYCNGKRANLEMFMMVRRNKKKK